MSIPIILPQPQQLTWRAGTLPLPTQIILPPATHNPIVELAAQRLATAIETAGGQRASIRAGPLAAGSPAFVLHLQPGAHPDEGYTIDDNGDDNGDNNGVQITLTASTPLGLSHAVETARQLLRTGEWARCQLKDWPDYRHRGIYVESFWGTDLMDLADWQQFIDYLVGLKLNTLNIGLHGCWEIKYNGVPTEFLLVPLRAYPQLQTPQTIRYIDPHTLTWQAETYLPRSVAQPDLLPRVFAYARERGLRIVPQFGGPGHNTLIPRELPAVSARTREGAPTGYGYCVSSQATWRFLDAVIEELVERYCRPFEVTHFNVAGDEVYPIRNVLPDAPDVEVTPWCACAACRQLSHFEQLTRYLLGWAERLAEQGIKAVVWADTLARMDRMDDFVQQVRARGLEKQIVVQWWCYKEPLPELTSAPKLETWVEPSPGLVGNLLYQDFSRNIYGFLQRGSTARATGVTAYNVPDLRLDKNYACLAEFSWNTGAGSIPHFHIRYAEQTYGADWRTALEAYDVAERVMGSYPLAVYVMDQLLHYFNNFPHGRVDYPLDLLRTLARDPLAILTGIRIVGEHMASAEQLLARVQTNPSVRDRFLLECRRYRTLTQAVLVVLDALRLVSDAQTQVEARQAARARAPVEQAQTLVQEAHAELAETMRAMTRLQAAYLQPSALRELSPLLSFLEDLRRQLADALAGEPTSVAELPLLQDFDLGRLRAVWHPWEF